MAPGFGLTLLAMGLISKKKLTGASLALIAAFFFAGHALATLETRAGGSDRLSKMYDSGLIASGEPVELTGVVQGQPEPAQHSFYLTLQVEKISVKGQLRDATGSVLLLAHVSADRVNAEFETLELRHGARVRVMTTLDRDEGFRNPGVPPFTEYLERKGYDATGVIKSPLLIERLDDATVFLPLAWTYEWRQHLQREFDAKFSPETAGVLAAALLGNRYNISRSAADRFRAGGTFHVLVISGLQIAFIGGLVFFITRYLIRRRLLQFLMAATFMWAYTLAVGAEASGSPCGAHVHAGCVCPGRVASRELAEHNRWCGGGAAGVATREPLRSFVSADFSFGAVNCVARSSGFAEYAAGWFLAAGS